MQRNPFLPFAKHMVQVFFQPADKKKLPGIRKIKNGYAIISIQETNGTGGPRYG